MAGSTISISLKEVAWGAHTMSLALALSSYRILKLAERDTMVSVFVGCMIPYSHRSRKKTVTRFCVYDPVVSARIPCVCSPRPKRVWPHLNMLPILGTYIKAYDCVQKYTGSQQQRQKELCNRRVYTWPTTWQWGVGVAAPACATPRLLKEVAPSLGRSVSCSRSDINYRIQHIEHPRKWMVVHFDQLKSCHLPACLVSLWMKMASCLQSSYQEPPWI